MQWGSSCRKQIFLKQATRHLLHLPRHTMSPGGTLVYHILEMDHPTVTSALNRQGLRAYAVRRNSAMTKRSEECLELDIGQASRSPVVSDDPQTAILLGLTELTVAHQVGRLLLSHNR